MGRTTLAAVWHGTQDDLFALQVAVRHHCVCTGSLVCPSHRMLTDQRVLDHPAFVHKNARAYIRAEFDPRSEFGMDQ